MLLLTTSSALGLMDWFQAVRDGAAKAAQDLISASTDVAKAEAAIALECYDALQKAVDHP